ncbi:MAG TPA: SRPBCC family protein [Candidatus Limnocylindria bacterium]
MPGFQLEARIARPVNDVFRVLTDVEQTERWFPARVHEYWTSDPPLGVGSMRHAVVTLLGRRTENDATVTEYDPPRRAALSGTQSGLAWNAGFDFHPEGEATRVVLDFRADASGGVRVALRPLLWWYRRAWRKGMARFARMMESGELG